MASTGRTNLAQPQFCVEVGSAGGEERVCGQNGPSWREGLRGPGRVGGLCLACQGGGGEWFLEANGMALKIATEEAHIVSALCSGKCS